MFEQVRYTPTSHLVEQGRPAGHAGRNIFAMQGHGVHCEERNRNKSGEAVGVAGVVVVVVACAEDGGDIRFFVNFSDEN